MTTLLLMTLYTFDNVIQGEGISVEAGPHPFILTERFCVIHEKNDKGDVSAYG